MYRKTFWFFGPRCTCCEQRQHTTRESLVTTRMAVFAVTETRPHDGQSRQHHEFQLVNDDASFSSDNTLQNMFGTTTTTPTSPLGVGVGSSPIPVSSPPSTIVQAGPSGVTTSLTPSRTTPRPAPGGKAPRKGRGTR